MVHEGGLGEESRAIQWSMREGWERRAGPSSAAMDNPEISMGPIMLLPT